MGEQKINMSELSAATGIPRHTIMSMFHEKAKRIDLNTVEQLCAYFSCEVGDLYEIVKDN
jgi:putative transcriptional regulator